jgi:hypothetical protein
MYIFHVKNFDLENVLKLSGVQNWTPEYRGKQLILMIL